MVVRELIYTAFYIMSIRVGGRCVGSLRYSSILTCLTHAIGVTVLARFKKFSRLPSRDLHRGNQYTVKLNSNLMLACNEPREDTRESRAFNKITRFLCYFSRAVTL